MYQPNNYYKCDIDFNNIINLDIKPEQLLQKTNDIIILSNNLYDKISKLQNLDINYENIVNQLQDEFTRFSIFSNTCGFFQYVSTDEELQNMSLECQKLLNEHSINIYNRKDLYNVINNFYQKINNSKLFKTKYSEDYRFIKFIIRNFIRSGIQLNDNDKKQLNILEKQISDLELQFLNNLNKDNKILLFTKKELNGLSDDFINNLDKDNDKYKITLKYPIYFPCMKRITVNKTRQKLEYEFNRRCLNNISILINLIKLRNVRAQMLGYNNHLDFVTETEVIKNGESAIKFVKDLLNKTSKFVKQDIKILQKLINNPDITIDESNLLFYTELLEKSKYNIDKTKLKEFFPLKHVIDATLSIYQTLFSLVFKENTNLYTWHPSVLTYDVYSNKYSNDFIGTFYLDLYPRQNKYSHAMCYPLKPACSISTKKKIYPVSAIVTNFSSNNNLLEFNEVKTFFHEFGHVMHQLLGRTKFSLFSGTSTETDFVEAPSQMLENWCWEKESLKLLSKHYITGKSLDDDTINNLIKAKNLLNGIQLRKQLFLTQFDLLIHSDQNLISLLNHKSLNAKLLYNILKKLKNKITKIPMTKNTFSVASFGHLAGGYDGRYYGYLWSQIYAADMFYSKFKNNLLNSNIGSEYITKILKKGGSVDGNILVSDFLNRKPNINNFLLSKGLIKQNNIIKSDNQLVIKPDNQLVIKSDNQLVIKPDNQLVIKSNFDYILTSEEPENIHYNLLDVV